MSQHKILFDNPNKMYFAGQKVSGKIEINLEESEQTKGIRLSITGKGQIEWKKIHFLSGFTTYSDEEEYLKIENYCVGGENHEVLTLPSGTQVYPFSVELPSSLPSSSENKFGHVRYTAKVILESVGKTNQEIKTAFTIISPYDLNKFPNLLEPVRESKEHCQCYCTHWIMTAVMEVEKTGYVCGEKIPVTIEINNNLWQDVYRANLILQQITTCHSRSSNVTTTDTVILEKIRLGPILQDNTKKWMQMLSIPPVPASDQNSTLLKIEYQIYLEVTHGLNNKKMILLIPIVIGTIPIIHKAIPTKNEENDQTPPTLSQTTSVDVLHPNIPKYTLAENEIFNAKSIRDANDDKNTIYYPETFTPCYPIYLYT